MILAAWRNDPYVMRPINILLMKYEGGSLRNLTVSFLSVNFSLTLRILLKLTAAHIEKISVVWLTWNENDQVDKCDRCSFLNFKSERHISCSEETYNTDYLERDFFSMNAAILESLRIVLL